MPETYPETLVSIAWSPGRRLRKRRLGRTLFRLLPALLFGMAGVVVPALRTDADMGAGRADNVESGNAEGVRYVGVRICARCHEEIYRGWLDTPHADAYDTLADIDRQELTGCIQCHTTGAGHWSGFASDLSRPYFAGVQCESCHGPGSVHSRLPAATTIRREVPERICMACHTESMSHGYHAAPARYRDRVIHRPAPVRAAEVPPPAERARIELYLMSFCPYGGEAARELAALQRSLGEATVEVEVRYIVRQTGDEPRSDEDQAVRREVALSEAGEACVDDGGQRRESADSLAAGFSSLHGPEEVIENLRQIVIARRYPDRSLDYIARRAALPEEDWQAVAAEFGIDPAVIESELFAARSRLAEDAEQARSLGIVASPTLRLNGVATGEANRGGTALARAVCAALTSAPSGCATLPACESDSDCRAPGMEGRCVDPGQPGARCVFSPAPPVTLHVFNDPGCGLCSPIEIVAGAKELFPNLELVAHDVTSGEGGDWIEAFGIDAVPAFVFTGAESSSVFPRIEELLDPEVEHHGLEGRRLGTRFHRGPLYFQRQEKPGRVDLFVDATGELSRNFFESLAELHASPEVSSILERADLHLHHVLEARMARDGTASPPRLVQRGGEAYLVPAGALPELASRLGDDDLAEARRQACIEMAGGEKVIDYLLDRAADGEVDSGDWRARVEGLGLDPSRIGFCAGSGEADPRLDADRRLAGELGIRAPALLVANRLRLDGLGHWNQGAFIRALAKHLPASDHPSAPLGAAVEEEAP